ncbi:glutathionylspermidine synthase family protein [Singulisphaera sp. PoT]|uniref:glutathionylspermidine synthase family protein n=1 Tax=Singulisphaera sp. PoT TaxID=3411797 RepID=UPI003BF4825D
MLRIATPPRPDWPKTVESQGLHFHSIGGEPYWDESAYYLLEAREVDQIEKATYTLDALCLNAVEHVITSGRLDEFDIPVEFHTFVAESWERDERTIYGRFDLAFDGNGPPKLLEYNADTPTALLEAAVIQWFWSQDLVRSSGVEPSSIDQFNSIHERLIEAWKAVSDTLGRSVSFAAMTDSLEDAMTITYLRDAATQAGLATQMLDVAEIGWNSARRVFTDLRERSMDVLFKLYPWEWMLREPFGQYLPGAPTRWLEPPWKMILSSKAILPVLWELFPDCPYLLRAENEPFGDTYVTKPVHSREGANVSIVREGRLIAETAGEYTGRRIYQRLSSLPEFDDRHAVVGSWIVNGHACGIGIREDDGPITRNTSRFVLHIFRTSAGVKPPIMLAKAGPGGYEANAKVRENPLWDRWLDPS